jgi:hypothetical protein
MDSKELRLFREAYSSIHEGYDKKKKGGCVDKEDKGEHNCAKKVCHESFGEGECIFGQHAVPDENGFVSHYDVMFEHGIERNVPVADMEVLEESDHPTSEGHEGMYDGEQIAEADLFDIVKGHLMSEGYADTEEAALAIMANMSEEWRQSIIEQGGAHYGLVGVPKKAIDAIPGVRALRTAASNTLHRMDYPGVKPVKVGDKVVPYSMINPGAYAGALNRGMKPAGRVTDLESGKSKSGRQIDKEMTRND